MNLLKTTLEQIKAAAETGTSKMIYYSSGTLWWTHIESELEEATERGKKIRDIRFEKMITDPEVPEEQKKRMTSLREKFDNPNVHHPPTDPFGAPLFTKPIKDWLEPAINSPAHFGKHGIDALMMAHNHNCSDHEFTTWPEINKVISDFEAVQTVGVVTPVERLFRQWVKENKTRYGSGTKFWMISEVEDMSGRIFANVEMGPLHENIDEEIKQRAIARIR